MWCGAAEQDEEGGRDGSDGTLKCAAGGGAAVWCGAAEQDEEGGRDGFDGTLKA